MPPLGRFVFAETTPGAAIAELASFVTEHEAMEAETSRVVAEVVQRKAEEQSAQQARQATARQAADAALAPVLAAGVYEPAEVVHERLLASPPWTACRTP